MKKMFCINNNKTYEKVQRKKDSPYEDMPKSIRLLFSSTWGPEPGHSHSHPAALCEGDFNHTKLLKSDCSSHLTSGSPCDLPAILPLPRESVLTPPSQVQFWHPTGIWPNKKKKKPELRRKNPLRPRRRIVLRGSDVKLGSGDERRRNGLL